jgi:hypothetical protein
MKAKNDVLRLRPVGGAHDPPQSLPRSDLATPSSRRVGADAHEVRRAQRDARFVAREPARAAWGQSIRFDQRQIHRKAPIRSTTVCSCFVPISRISQNPREAIPKFRTTRHRQSAFRPRVSGRRRRRSTRPWFRRRIRGVYLGRIQRWRGPFGMRPCRPAIRSWICRASLQRGVATASGRFPLKTTDPAASRQFLPHRPHPGYSFSAAIATPLARSEGRPAAQGHRGRLVDPSGYKSLIFLQRLSRKSLTNLDET